MSKIRVPRVTLRVHSHGRFWYIPYSSECGTLDENEYIRTYIESKLQRERNLRMINGRGTLLDKLAIIFKRKTKP